MGTVNSTQIRAIRDSLALPLPVLLALREGDSVSLVAIACRCWHRCSYGWRAVRGAGHVARRTECAVEQLLLCGSVWRMGTMNSTKIRTTFDSQDETRRKCLRFGIHRCIPFAVEKPTHVTTLTCLSQRGNDTVGLKVDTDVVTSHTLEDPHAHIVSIDRHRR